jgi:D-arabinose 1-dehydrogenase-like Zn-dependent alcohol dehydrogenase
LGVVVPTRWADDSLRQLGAWRDIDSQTQNPAEELTKLGGARIILATVTSGKAMAAVMGGLGIDGKMIIVGAADPLDVSPTQMIGGRRSIGGWPSGRSIDSQDTLRFSALTSVRSMNEVFPLERAAEATPLSQADTMALMSLLSGLFDAYRLWN